MSSSARGFLLPRDWQRLFAQVSGLVLVYGSLLLQPAGVVPEAQHEYDSDENLRALLARAAASPTVRRRRDRRPE